MRFVGNRSKRWSGYIIIALTVAAAWLTRNRPRYRSRFPYTTNTPYGGTASSAAGKARVYNTDQARAAATATAATAGAARVYDRAEDPSPYLTRRLDGEEADRYRNRRRALYWLVPLLLIPFLVCLVAWLVARNGGVDSTTSNTPASVQVSSQPAGNTVTVNRVTAPQDGWVALYRTDANGQPNLNAPVGVAPVAAGEQTDVPVPLKEPVAPGEQLAAVLHADNGAAGTFEPNGADSPVTVDGSSAATTFALSAAGANAVADAGTNAQGSEPPQPQPLPPSPTQAAVTTSTASDAATSPAAFSNVAGGSGTSTEQSAAAGATSEATATAVMGAAGASAVATVGATEELNPSSTATANSLAVGAATDQASTATIDDETLEATVDVPSSTAAANDPATAEAVAPTSGAATAATNEVATPAASEAATAPAIAGGEIATLATTVPPVNVGANEASMGAAQRAAGSDSVTLDRVVAPQNGWVAITRLNPDGTPNLDAVLGTAPVQAGENTNVQVPLSEALGAGDAVAVLLADEGVVGTFDPDGADRPVVADGALVAANVAGSTATGTDQTATSSVGTQATSDTSASMPSTATAEPSATSEATATAALAVTAATDTTAATDQAAGTTAAQEGVTAAPTPEPTATAEPISTPEPTIATSAAPTAAPTNTVAPTQTATATAEATATQAPSTSMPTTAPTATLAPTSTTVPVPTATRAASASGSSATTQPSASAAPSAPLSLTTSAAVNNATLVGDTVVIDEVTVAQNGWIVLQRADANGQSVPDGVVGVAPVQAGTTDSVQVPLTAALAPGDKIVVLLYADAGVVGTFEYAGPDTPLTDANTAPVLTVQAPGQLPETGTLAGLWMAVLVAALVAGAAGVLLRQHFVR